MKIRVAALVLVIGCVAAAVAMAAQGGPDRSLRIEGAATFPKLSPLPPWVDLGDPILARLHLAPVPPGSKLPGYLMIADRDNNRLIIVNPAKQIVWRFPPGHGAGSPSILSEPDDAFVSADGRYISTNQEFNETIRLITLNTHARIVWSYGHAAAAGSATGYLSHPDDAYLLQNNLIRVADIVNCRVVWINRRKRIVRTLGIDAQCAHAPPHQLTEPNGDTPLPDGGMLVTEIGGWVDRFSRTGRLLWSFPSPTTYPSDAQLMPDGNVLLASYTAPGRVDIITPRGRVVWTYEFTRPPRALNHPSLAIPLPGGMIALNDDFNHRVVVIDPKTKQIVWQYGHDGVAGSKPGYLNTPDGIDLLP
jgi:hypothetical protein